MPIWLDVAVDDPCIAANYGGDPSGSAEGGSAQVIGPDGMPRPPGITTYQLRHGGFDRRVGDCPSNAMGGLRGASRVPLHLVADVRAPGQYSVRWSVPFTTKLGKIPPASVTFAVLPSTPEQREAWLRDMLAHTPDKIDDLRQTYIPSLLAAPDDPRVTHKLLDVMCSPDHETSLSVLTAFGPLLADESRNYLANLIAHGCLTDAVWHYLNRTIVLGHMFRVSDQQNWPPLLQAALTAIPRAHGASLTNGIGIIAMLKPEPADPMAAKSDAAILRAAPEIIAGKDLAPNQYTFNDQKYALINAFGLSNHSPEFRAILRALAAQSDDAAGYALVKLMSIGDPADISFLRTRLMGNMDGWGFEDPFKALEASPEMEDFATLPKKFGLPGEQLLQSLMQAQNPHIRAVAAMLLAGQHNRAAITMIIGALRSDKEPDTTALLNEALGTGACPDEDQQCHRVIVATTDARSPWVVQRKAAAIKYFQDQLARLK
jgi:hypothetical protein